ncbi:MAG TPA: protein kinase [Polyangiaceae bacterium]
MAPRQLTAGTLLSGRYQLGEVLGESDLSTVYAAADLRGGAPVALKVFDASVVARPAALSEYQTQARQASSFGVEGIARAYDFGIDANNGVAFSTAERVPWASLDRRVLAQGPLGVAELSAALAVVARALDAAHAGRVVHRDLKPQNVFISPDNPEWVRITDFGVSAVRRGAPEAMGWGGPPGYTPPDAVDAAAVATPAADLFALGVIAFFALTRGTPFRSLRNPVFDPNAHWSELNQSLNPVSERAKEIGVALDPAFDPWFARALALSPQERYRSAGEMARELAGVAEQLSARGGGPRTIPGIAAAIAQPLVFQPEPSPASLGLSGTAPLSARSPFASAASSAAAAPTAATTVARGSFGDQNLPELPKTSRNIPFVIGAGMLLLAGFAAAGYIAYRKGSESPAPEASVAPPPSAAAAAAPVAPSAAASVPGAAEPSPLPETAPPPDAAASAAAPEPAAAAPKPKAAAAAPKAATITAKPAAAPKAATTAKPATTAAKPATTTAKPATTTAKPAATTTKTKKKCSPFLGCK